VWIVAVVAVWLVWQGLSGWPAFEDDFDSPVASPVSERFPADPGSEEEAPAGQASSVADGESDAPLRAVEDVSVEESLSPPEPGMAEGVVLPYSVLVASHVTYEDAAAERDQLTESGSLAFVAPTPIGGRLYYRVFAGALEDRFQASDLMRRLVEQRSKERERDWDMRPVRLAFALRDFSSEEEADAERERLHELGVPAYVLPVGDTTGAIYRLYSGAFESEGAAGPADTLLSVAGQAATLVTRRGEPR
jgi:cell division septation protein DedD